MDDVGEGETSVGMGWETLVAGRRQGAGDLTSVVGRPEGVEAGGTGSVELRTGVVARPIDNAGLPAIEFVTVDLLVAEAVAVESDRD